MTDSPQSRWRQGRPLLLLAVGLLLVVLWAGLKAYRVLALARSLQDRLDQVEQLVSDEGAGWRAVDLEQVRDLVYGARLDLASLRLEVEPFLPLASALCWLPGYGPDLAALEPLFDLGQAGVEAAVLLVDPLLPLAESLQASSLSPLAALGELVEIQPALAEVEVRLAYMEAARDQIPPAGHSPRVKAGLDLLDRYLSQAQIGLRVARLLPNLMGMTGPRTYLLVAQNEDEVRPTGGFISSVGLVTVDRGQIVSLAFEDSYAVDDWKHHAYPDLPEPFQRIMGDGIWLLRDANWSPDWPTAARQIVNLYQISRQVPVDGVIALNQRAVQMLVGPLGPLQVGEEAEPVTDENVLSFMRQAWLNPLQGEDSRWWHLRKAFVADLAAAMKDRLLNEPGLVDLPGLVTALRAALDRRHVLVFLNDPELQAAVHLVGWDGALRPGSGDYLLVVDANMGFNKVAPRVEQAIDYQVSLVDPAAPRASVSLFYTHTSPARDEPCLHTSIYEPTAGGYMDLVDRCLWDYVRVYPPAGSALVGASLHPLSGAFLTSQRDWPGDAVVRYETVLGDGMGSQQVLSLANLFLLPWGQRQLVQFGYVLPGSVIAAADGTSTAYELLVQKQAGRPGVPLRVTVQLPAGSEVVETEPSGRLTGQTVTFDVVLYQDQAFRVEWVSR